MQPLGTSLQSMPYRLEAGHTPVSLCFLPWDVLTPTCASAISIFHGALTRTEPVQVPCLDPPKLWDRNTSVDSQDSVQCLLHFQPPSRLFMFSLYSADVIVSVYIVLQWFLLRYMYLYYFLVVLEWKRENVRGRERVLEGEREG
jgi:hypothetical protein